MPLWPALGLLALAAVFGVVWLAGSVRAAGYFAALDAYAERELARARHRPHRSSAPGNRVSEVTSVVRDRIERDRRRGITQGGTDMLVLSGKRGERIVIPGCSVTITVVAVEGNRVRLGIAAPAKVAVLREELVERKKRPAAGRA